MTRKITDIAIFISFATQALEGLHAIHCGGLLHLDIKPSNIMISEQVSGREIVKIVDFGRAQLIKDSDNQPPQGLGMNGSIYYSSPEQLLSEELDIRTDFYALGCVFYWVLTGTRPFDGDNTIQVMSSHLQHYLPAIQEINPSLPPWLCEWVTSLIHFDKEQRPHSIQEIIGSLMEGKQLYLSHLSRA